MQWAKEDGIIIRGPLINDVAIFQRKGERSKIEKMHMYKKSGDMGVEGKEDHILQYFV